MKEVKNCIICRKEFLVRKDKILTAKCCSLSCKGKYGSSIGAKKRFDLLNNETFDDSMKRMQILFEKKFEKTNSCWNWTGALKDEKKLHYGCFTFRRKNYLAHRASWLIYKKEDIGSSLVLHICDNPRCVNPSHLYLGNALDNQRDKLSRGRCKVEKLSINQVREIKNKLKNKIRITKLSKEYNVSRQTIYQIRIGNTWKDI